MKKILSILLAVAMSFSLVACVSNQKQQTPNNKPSYHINHKPRSKHHSSASRKK